MSGSSKVIVPIHIDAELLTRANTSGTDISQAAESGIRRALDFVATAEQDARREAWMAENAEAIQSSNEYVRHHGLPLAKHRMF